MNTALQELKAAHRIIQNAMAVMTTAQKSEWGRLNERDGVAGEGVTRANEREAAMARASQHHAAVAGLSAELAGAGRAFATDALRAGPADVPVAMSPADAHRLADLLHRAAVALTTTNIPTGA